MAPRFLRQLWQALPARARRAGVHGLAGALAPASPACPKPAELAGAPWIVVGFLSSPSGLGQAARLAAKALRAEGRETFIVDIGDVFHEMTGFIPHDFADARGHRDAAHVLLVVNAPYLPIAFWRLGKSWLHNKLILGSWAWELPRLDADWARGFDRVHGVIVPSAFNAAAVHEAAPHLPCTVLAHPVGLDAPPAMTAHGADAPFTVASVLSIASGFERKNPLAIVAAFRQAFGNSRRARLLLNVSGADHYPQGAMALRDAVAGADNIAVHWGARSRAELSQWWSEVDVYLAMHRAEGFGLPLAEAMVSGYPVVATGWSGNADFMTEGTSFSVPYTLVPVVDPQGKYDGNGQRWAEPSVDAAAGILQRLFEDPELGQQAGENARHFAQKRFGPAAFVAGLEAAARSIIGNN